MDVQLFALLRGFFALTSLNALKLPENCPLLEINNFLIQHILLNEHFQAYPPSEQFQRRFWKWIIEALEDRARKCVDDELDSGFEIDAQIYNHYVSLMPTSGPACFQKRDRCLPGRVPPQQSYITHFWDPGNPLSFQSTTQTLLDLSQYQKVTSLESRTTIESGTTGLRTWKASFVLSQYLTLHPDLVISKRVLELGSGIGFLGIIVATLQMIRLNMDSTSSSSLFLSDINEEVLTRCRDNINLPCNLSSQHHNVDFVNLDWSQSTDPEQSSTLEILMQRKLDPDVILGADVVFDPALISSLVGTLKIALLPTQSRRNKVALIALTVRNKETVNKFITRVQESKLTIDEVHTGCKETPFSESIETDNESVKMFHITQAA